VTLKSDQTMLSRERRTHLLFTVLPDVNSRSSLREISLRFPYSRARSNFRTRETNPCHKLAIDVEMESLMPIYAPVFEAFREADIPFVVIGGHAVVLHGHHRNTFDLDLLISEPYITAAKSLLELLGYAPYFESGAFVQLTPRSGLPPLDIMIVDETTFERLSQFTESRVLDGENIQIPDPKRLIAMKLHALKAVSRSNREKDWDDIAGVIRATNQDIEDHHFQEILKQYGQPGAIDEIRRRL